MNKESKLLGQDLCEERGWSFDQQFPHQYVLLKSELSTPPEGWIKHQHNQWTLWHCTRLPVCTVKDSNGALLGLLWGMAVDPNGAFVANDLRVPFVKDAADFVERFETWVVDLRGRFALMIDTPDGSFLYSDVGGDIGVLFDPETARVGSSLPVMLSREINLHPTIADFKDLRKGTSFARFRDTPDAAVTRLNPNHRLNLESFETKRFWPREVSPILETEDEKADLMGKIAQRLCDNVAAFANGTQAAMPVSGGYDSRVLFLMADKMNAKLCSVFSHRVNWITGYDAIMGNELCRLVGKSHTLVDATAVNEDPKWHKKAVREQMANWVRAGYAKPMATRVNCLAFMLIPDCKVVLRGNIMEMLGGRFHKIGAPRKLWKVYKYIYGRQAKTDIEKDHWWTNYENWRADLPEMADKNVLDLCFIECLYPSDMAVALQSVPVAFYLNPYADRRLIEWTMQYPSEQRCDGELLRGLLKWANPDVPIPINPRKFARADEGGKALQVYLDRVNSSNS